MDEKNLLDFSFKGIAVSESRYNEMVDRIAELEVENHSIKIHAETYLESVKDLNDKVIALEAALHLTKQALMHAQRNGSELASEALAAIRKGKE